MEDIFSVKPGFHLGQLPPSQDGMNNVPASFKRSDKFNKEITVVLWSRLLSLPLSYKQLVSKFGIFYMNNCLASIFLNNF